MSNSTPTGSVDGQIRKEVEKLYLARMPNPETGLFDVKTFIDSIVQLILAREDDSFKEGQRVGQYQAADKMYGSVTQMWLFKDDASPVLNDPERADTLLKDCEKYMNHNRKTYISYIHGDRYKRLQSLPNTRDRTMAVQAFKKATHEDEVRMAAQTFKPGTTKEG